MRRALALLLVLTLLGAAGLAYAHHAVGASAEAVEMRETVLCGDNTAARGIRAHMPVYSGWHLFWDTELETASDGAPVTAFRYSSLSQSVRHGQKYYGLNVNLMTNMGASGSFGPDFDFESEYFGGYEDGYYMAYGDVLRDVASRTAPGQEHTEYVELTDWIDYVPLQFDLDLPGFYYEYDDGEEYIGTNRGSMGLLGAKLSEYFRLPLTGPRPMEVRVSRNLAGEIVGWQVNGVDEYVDEATDSPYMSENAAAVSAGTWDGMNVGSMSVVTEDACYFVFDEWSSERGTGRVDFSALPGGRGVYRLPIETVEYDNSSYHGSAQEATRVYLDDIETVLPVADGEYVELLDTDGERLLILTVGDGKLYLTQASLPELTDVKKTALADMVELEDGMRDGCSRAVQSEGLYYLETAGGRVLLLESVNGGGYELALDVPKDFAGSEESVESILWDRGIRQSYSDNNSSLLWDGERLAVARWCGSENYGFYGEANGFVLWVYDRTGLLYCGVYDSSLSCPPTERYSNAVRASGDLGLQWK